MTYIDDNEFTLQPSYWTVLPVAAVSIGLCFVGFPVLLVFLLIQVLDIACWKYQFNERTITERKGILSVDRTELHYSRIKSIKIHEPFLFRLVGLSNVTIKSSDPYMPELKLYAISSGLKVRSYLRAKADKWRKTEGVREFDMYRL